MADPREVEIARGWLGTPYIHQASMRGAGADCLGLIRGIWREMHGDEPEVPPAYTGDWAECGGTEALWQAALRHLCPVPDAAVLAPGQVLLFCMREGAIAKHLGLVSQAGTVSQAETGPRFIHAYTSHGVIESPLTRPWASRIVARFCFP